MTNSVNINNSQLTAQKVGNKERILLEYIQKKLGLGDGSIFTSKKADESESKTIDKDAESILKEIQAEEDVKKPSEGDFYTDAELARIDEVTPDDSELTKEDNPNVEKIMGSKSGKVKHTSSDSIPVTQ